ncbi:universal stress protein (plasmid) [Leisingera caerulea]|uniref:Universal stress protein n=1 Tax=Leisingera caerulea TaxID=506591 RepID=A0ABY5X1U9_LEICA|nr:universal stress protein [Leisingera caerulea]UWQ60583.1 universal stress protein [Leisingera caerulea]
MQRRTLLFAISGSTSDTAITAAAEAAREQQAHLACLLLKTLPGMPYFAYGASAYGAMAVPDEWLETLQSCRTAQTARAAEVEALLSRCNTAGDVQYATASDADIRLLAARRALTCDIAEAAGGLREDPEVFRDAVHGILFGAPVPLMVNGSPFVPRKRVFLAWNSSLSAARAAHAALPYFKAAQEVVIGCFDPDMSDARDDEDPGADMAAWLSHHGCTVTLSQFPSGGHDTGTAIQDRAREAGADLVVMGAYGHSRLREAVFGGTTRSLLEQTALPVLFAH